jgi:hypothetical protein
LPATRCRKASVSLENGRRLNPPAIFFFGLGLRQNTAFRFRLQIRFKIPAKLNTGFQSIFGANFFAPPEKKSTVIFSSFVQIDSIHDKKWFLMLGIGFA